MLKRIGLSLFISLLAISFSCYGSAPSFTLLSSTPTWQGESVFTFVYEDYWFFFIDDQTESSPPYGFMYDVTNDQFTTLNMTLCGVGLEFVNSQNQFFCINAHEGSDYVWINEVDPFNSNEILLKSRFAASAFYPPTTIQGDYFVMEPYAVHDNALQLSAYSTLERKLTCNMTIPSFLYYDYEAIPTSNNAFWVAMVNNTPNNYEVFYYDCSSNSVISSAKYKGSMGQNLNSFIFNQSTIMLNLHFNNKDYYAIPSMLVDNQVKIGTPLSFANNMANDKEWLHPINDTHFAVLYTQEGCYYIGIYYVNPQIEITQADTINLNLCFGSVDFEIVDGNLYVAYFSADSDSSESTDTLHSLYDTNAIYDLDSLYLINVISAIDIPLQYSNGSTIIYSHFGYWIVNSDASTSTFIQQPINSFYYDYSNLDTIWGFYNPNAKGSPNQAFNQCYITKFTQSSSQIEQTFFTECPCQTGSDEAETDFILDDVQYDSQGNYRIIYRCDLDSLYILQDNQFNLLMGNLGLSQEASLVFADYINSLIHTVYEGTNKNTSLSTKTYSMTSGTQKGNGVISLVPYGRYILKVNRDLLLYNDPTLSAGRNNIKIYNVTSSTSLFTLALQTAVTSNIVPLGVTLNSRAPIDAFAFIGTNGVDLYNAQGQNTFIVNGIEDSDDFMIGPGSSNNTFSLVWGCGFGYVSQAYEVTAFSIIDKIDS